MKVYQMFVPELNLYVKFKVLSPEDTALFLLEIGPLEDDAFCKAVLKNLVFNMRTEIVESLKVMSPQAARATIEALYNGCIMLNPGLDIDLWVSIAYSSAPVEISNKGMPLSMMPENALPKRKAVEPTPKLKRKKLSNAKFANLKNYLSERVVGQKEAIDLVCNALKRSQAGLADTKKPLGVFLFAGASGIGKTSLAKELHSYLYGDNTSIVRIDCGEYQHKHDNQKLIGCFTPETQILKSDGTTKNIEDVKIGEYVVTHKGRTKQVEYVHTYTNEAPMCKIDISNSNVPLVTTPSHEILAIKSDKTNKHRLNVSYGQEDLSWVKAGDLKKDDIIVYPRYKKTQLISQDKPLNIDLDIGEVSRTGIQRKLFMDDEYVYFRINDVSEVDYQGKVYDLAVKDDVSYVANSVAVHNSPPGYIGHDDGGQLTNAVQKNPNTVVLLDEIEKAHSDMWHTFLRIFDEGMATDSKGQEIDFRNAIIIMTTNLGNDKVADHLTHGSTGFNARIETSLLTKDLPPRSVVERHTNDAIKKLFKPEFLNRIDSVVIFNHLRPEDFTKIAEMEMAVLDEKLSKKGISLQWSEGVVDALIDQGVDTILGARGISQIRREKLETILADAILKLKKIRGTAISIDFDEDFKLDIREPIKTKPEKQDEF